MVITSSDRVPFSNLSIQWRQVRADVMPDLERLFEQSAFCLGPWVEKFEKAVAAYLGAHYVVGVNSGTSALHLSLIAAGIRPGDHVLIPANTFIATAWAVLYAGGVPVLCDVQAKSWTIDIADAERRLTDKTRAIIPVHLYGRSADLDAIRKFARKYKLAVVEDAAQAIGARFEETRIGSHSPFVCFSFYPGKNLGAAGEGGLVATSDPDAAERIRRLRHHAQSERYVHSELGFNYRMEGVQALVLLHKLSRLDLWTAERRRIAKLYNESLAVTPLELPELAGEDHVWHLYVVHTSERDRLRDHLAQIGIEAGLHYPVPLHRQPALREIALASGAYEVTDRNARECLSLPIFAGMTDDQVDRVIGAIRGFYGIS